MTKTKVIGIDFDNTIIRYDDAFHAAARERKLISASVPADKELIRNHLRAAGREDDWTRLQGYVYGEGIKLCRPFAGVLQFLRSARNQGFKTLIISHKTAYPILGPASNLHDAAHSWLGANGFYDTADTGITTEDVNFAPTRIEKLGLIEDCRCDFFIDDLPEFLTEPEFPARARRILFDPHNSGRPDAAYIKAISWEQIGVIILGA